MKKYILYPLLIVLFLLTNNTNAQHSGNSYVSIETVHSSGADLPFWLSHNQSGIYPLNASSCQLATLNTHQRFDSLFHSSLGFMAGGNVIASYSSQFTIQLNELYGGIKYHGFKLQGGLFRENEYFKGLSTTNGSLDRSLNARPLPRIRFSTDEFIPFFFWKDWFSFKAEYDEGLLGNDQYVRNAHLHHKSLYGRFRLKNQVYLTAALNHFVMWGGNSPQYGKLPDDFKAYLTYITGQEGTSDFPMTDQLNVAGNQFGTYLLQLDIHKENYNLSIYYNHPFEDHSGMEYDNWKDLLLGVFIDFKKNGIIEQAMYEYMYTINQSGSIHKIGFMRGRDNYFNHGYYRSGYTYEGYALCTPLFSPLRLDNGIVMGIENNRIWMHHLAVRGTLCPNLTWSGRITFSHNLGAFDINEFKQPKNQISSVLSFNYSNQKLPVDIMLSLAADRGQLYEDRYGAMIRISKSF